MAYLTPHELARHYMLDAAEPIITTQWVLAELGNYLAERESRKLFAPFVLELYRQPRFTILPADDQSFRNGIDLYDHRPDKQWSFTDCASFRVMKSRRMREALTADHHFEQAGFVALLK